MQKFSIENKDLQKKYSSILYLLWAAALAFCIVAPMVVGKYYVSFISLIFIYVILAASYNISHGFCGICSFASAALYGVGAYVSAICITTFHLPFVVGVVAGTLAAGILSLVVSMSAYKASGTYLTLISIGLLEIVQEIFNSWTSVTGGAAGFFVDKWIIFGIDISRNGKYYIILAIAVLCIALQKNLKESAWGRDFLAFKDNEIAAAGVGINFRKSRIIGFFISSALAGIAGALYASFNNYISPDTYNFNLTMMILLMAICGGIGTISGPIVGATIITIIPELFNNYPDAKQLIYGAMLIVMVQVMPKGIVGIIKEKFIEVENNIYIKKHKKNESADLSVYAPEGESKEDILVVEGLTRQYGGLTAVGDLNFTVKSGTVHSLIGPNGAGKTTTVNMITGIEKPTRGQVFFNGEDVTGQPMYTIVSKGITRTYQHVRLFNSMHVIDNVVIGTRANYGYGLLAAFTHTRTMKKKEEEAYLLAQDCLDIIGLGDKSNYFPSNMSAGQQKLLEIARALILKPRLLVLDEPCAGLTESEAEQFADLILRIKETGISVLLIEHHMNLVMKISDHITVIDHGLKIAEGTPEAVSANPVVRAAYLGNEV